MAIEHDNVNAGHAAALAELDEVQFTLDSASISLALFESKRSIVADFAQIILDNVPPGPERGLAIAAAAQSQTDIDEYIDAIRTRRAPSVGYDTCTAGLLDALTNALAGLPPA